MRNVPLSSFCHKFRLWFWTRDFILCFDRCLRQHLCLRSPSLQRCSSTKLHPWRKKKHILVTILAESQMLYVRSSVSQSGKLKQRCLQRTCDVDIFRARFTLWPRSMELSVVRAFRADCSGAVPVYLSTDYFFGQHRRNVPTSRP